MHQYTCQEFQQNGIISTSSSLPTFPMLFFAHFTYIPILFPLLNGTIYLISNLFLFAIQKVLKTKYSKTSYIMQILVYVVFKHLGLPSLYIKPTHENIWKKKIGTHFWNRKYFKSLHSPLRVHYTTLNSLCF